MYTYKSKRYVIFKEPLQFMKPELHLSILGVCYIHVETAYILVIEGFSNIREIPCTCTGIGRNY